jgi:hypothetical protein
MEESYFEVNLRRGPERGEYTRPEISNPTRCRFRSRSCVISELYPEGKTGDGGYGKFWMLFVIAWYVLVSPFPPSPRPVGCRVA